MKFFSRLRILAVLAAALLVVGERTEAQGFGLGVTNSANSILVSNALTYTISVTNLTGFLLPDALVSNALPASVQFLYAASSQGSFTNYGSVVVFDLGSFIAAGIAQMSLTVQPTVVGFITNTVTVITTNLAIAPVSTNSVTQVTNTVPLEADLGLVLSGSAQPTNIVNDWITYAVTVTNLGPSDAPDVILTNILPPGVILIKISPPNQSYSVVSSNLIFNLGALVSGGFTNLQFTIQPTNAGILNLSASAAAAGVVDTNSANNSASTNIAIINYLSTQLSVSLVSTQKYNPQNGLVEQTVTVLNTGQFVPAARVVVTNLNNQPLFNAVGTNNGSPFVVYISGLAGGQSVNLLLQFYVANYFPLAGSQLQAFGVPVPDFTPPAATSTSTSLNISRIVRLTNGNMLVEFPSTVGQTYTVVYSDNILFSNAMIAPPSIVATANRLQWIDYGPPTTASTPTNSSARFYRIFLNP
jgi:uncharacterized repeat protein (TIGR01451 family)